MKYIALFAAPTLALAIGLSIHLVTAGGSAARSGRVTTRHVGGVPHGRIVRGRVLFRPHGSKTTLTMPASAPLVGNLGPVATESRDGRYLAYNTWTWVKPIDWRRSLGAQGIARGDPLGTPRVHVRDLRRPSDEALEPGSFSIAWRSDGGLAYVRGSTTSYRDGMPFVGDVVVRSRVGDEPASWSRAPDRYLVEAWAGRRLLVRRAVDGEAGDLLVFDGPGSFRILATDADLIAVSPAGAEAVVVASRAQTATPSVELISTANGAEEARIALGSIVDPVTRTPLQDVVGIGSWRGDEVVAASSAGLVVFRVRAGSLSVEQVLHVDAAARAGGGFYEPQLSGDGRTVVTWADLPETGGRESAQTVCDRYALTCTESAPVPSSSAPRPVYDPSGGVR